MSALLLTQAVVGPGAQIPGYSHFSPPFPAPTSVKGYLGLPNAPCGLHRCNGLVSVSPPHVVLKEPEPPPHVAPWAEDASQCLPPSSKVPSYRDNKTLAEEDALGWKGK